MSEGLRKEIVKSTWENVLKEEVDDDTDFFEAGGDSLAAVKICSQLEELLDVRPELWTIFDNPRLGDFIQECSRLTEKGGC